MTDADRESLIEAALEQMLNANSFTARQQHWRDLVYHVRLRSPEQVLKMETERRIGVKYAPLFTYDSMGSNQLMHLEYCRENHQQPCGYCHNNPNGVAR